METRMHHKNNKGYTLVETIIYVAILAVIYFIIVNTLLSFNSSYKNIVALRTIDNSATNAMERMTRDIRWATSLDTTNSTFGTNAGVLTVIATGSSVSTTTKFYLDNGVVKMDINGVYYGPLTLTTARVTDLMFRNMNNGTSTAIKIDMTITSGSGSASKTRSYHDTILIKGI